MASPIAGARRHFALWFGVTAGLAVPVVLTLVAIHDPRWFPSGDLAVIETRVGEVASSRPPLVGLLGRLGTFTDPGYHPGPLGFYALWPLYAAAGGSAWALNLSNGLLTVLALGASCWIASRRGGPVLVIGVAASLAIVLVALDPSIPVTPWNPYQPVFWWPVVLLGVWSVLDDDLAVLPLTVFAGSLCAQTHISYAGLVGGLGVLTAAVLGTRMVRRRGDQAELRRLALWTGGAVALSALLWLPPVAQQLFGTHPNLSALVKEFTNPTKPALGWRKGLELVLCLLDPVRLATGRTELAFAGRRSPTGIAASLAWVASAVVSLRLPDRRVRRLHAVIAAGIALGLASTAAIHGPSWDYLLLWGWTLSAQALLATAWTWASVLRSVTLRAGPRSARYLIDRTALVTTTVVALLFTAVATVNAADTTVVNRRANAILEGVVPRTIAALERSEVPGQGPAGRYLVEWEDSVTGSGVGIGLANELRRAGLDVGVGAPFAVGLSNRWARAPTEATALVTLAVGPAVDRWRRCDGATEIAAYYPRTPAPRMSGDQILDQARDELTRAGLADLVPFVDEQPLRVFRDPRLGEPAMREVVGRLLRIFTARADLDYYAAVFAGPSDLSC